MTRAETQDWTVYDRAELRDSISLPAGPDRAEYLLALDDLHCAACVKRVGNVLASKGASGRINLAARTAEVDWPAQRPLSELLRALDASGFAPRVLAQSAPLREPARGERSALRRMGVAVFGSMQVMMLAWPAYTHAADLDPALAALLRYAQWLFATPVVLYAGWPFFENAWHALKGRAMNMDVPVALALAIAYFVSAARTVAGSGDVYFDTATMFVLLLAVGRHYEGRSRAKASERLRLLAGKRVLTAMRRAAVGVEQVPVSALRIADEVVVAPGEDVPIDGTVADPMALLDEALLTGEARAVQRACGERALAGSINVGNDPVTLRVTAVGEATRLSQITRLLNRAQSERPAFAVVADRIAGHFIVLVLVLAATAGGFWLSSGTDVALSVALAVLVASCPCALALAVPAAYAAATSRLAADGVLVVNARSLSRLASVDTVIFDKTGTLTRPGFELARVVPLPGQSVWHCSQIAAALEAGGTHPIARAFAHIETPAPATGVTHERGRGIAGEIAGRRYTLGPLQGDGNAPPLPVEVREHPQFTWLELASDRPLGFLGLAATARPEAAEAVRTLSRAGLRIDLLSGDAAEPVRHLAEAAGIERYAARQSPEDKLARAQALQAQGRIVLAVGDGVNDAPLLGAADVAVVMPHGTALAQGSADAILVGDSLAGLVRLLAVGARTEQVIRQNIAWALLYNLAVLPLAAANLLHPWLAALGMSVSSLLVVGNALRLSR